MQKAKRLIILFLLISFAIACVSACRKSPPPTENLIPPDVQPAPGEESPDSDLGSNIGPTTPDDKPAVPPSDDKDAAVVPIAPEMIESFFHMTKDELIDCLGGKYEMVGTGAEGSYDGYYFKNYGLSFTFEDDDTLAWIDAYEGFKINGASSGMTFSQIKECLGDTEIIEGWWEGPHIVSYSLEYIIGKCKYSFMIVEMRESAIEPDAQAGLTIYWYRRNLDVGSFNWLYTMNKDDIMEIYGASEWNGYLIGEEPKVVDTGITGYTGYYFKEQGLTFAFEKDGAISFIIADETVEFSGAGTGMDFSEIMESMGETKAIQSGSNSQGKTTYSIEYIRGGFLFSFISFDPDGSNSTMYVKKI